MEARERGGIQGAKAMTKRQITALLARALVALETPERMTPDERSALIDAIFSVVAVGDGVES